MTTEWCDSSRRDGNSYKLQRCEILNMKTGHKGNISEILVIGELMRNGYEVAIPYGNCPNYDLLVLGKDGLWKRVQVKTAYKRATRANNTYIDFLRGSGKGKRRYYTRNDIDFLVGIKQDDLQFWVFSAEEVEGKRCATVCNQSKQWKNLNVI